MATPCLTHVPKLSHLYAQLHINIIHPCKYEEISLNNKGGVIRTRIFKVFRKMWLPWQRLVLPKLSHLYAQLHINIIHPCKYEEISLNNKGEVIRTRIVIKEELSAQEFANLLTDRRTDGRHTPYHNTTLRGLKKTPKASSALM